MPAHAEEEVLALMLQEVREALDNRLASFTELTELGDSISECGLTPEFYAHGIRDDIFWQEELQKRLREIADERVARELFALEKRRIESANCPQSKTDERYAKELEDLEDEFERATRAREDERRQKSDHEVAKKLQRQFDKENVSQNQTQGMVDSIIETFAERKVTKEAKIGFFRRLVNGIATAPLRKRSASRKK